MDSRRHILDAPRDHLVHIMPRLEVGGCFSTMLVVIEELKQYAHTVLTECDLSQINADLIWAIQSYGADLLVVPRITEYELTSSNYTAAIMYNVEDHPGLGKALPSLYYNYGIYDPATNCTSMVACSMYAHLTNRRGVYQPHPEDAAGIVPPLVQTRPLRRLKGQEHPFTVGIMSSGSYGKYPCEFVMQMLGRLPEDVRVMLSTLPKYPHPGMPLALADRLSRCPGRLLSCAVRPLAAIYYMLMSDVIICASSPAHFEPYGRIVMEAMAIGKPVVCERRGALADSLDHGINALMFDTVDEALEHVDRIHKDPKIASKLGNNAQLRASWEDVTVHVGMLKRVLRMIGA